MSSKPTASPGTGAAQINTKRILRQFVKVLVTPFLKTNLIPAALFIGVLAYSRSIFFSTFLLIVNSKMGPLASCATLFLWFNPQVNDLSVIKGAFSAGNSIFNTLFYIFIFPTMIMSILSLFLCCSLIRPSSNNNDGGGFSSFSYSSSGGFNSGERFNFFPQHEHMVESDSGMSAKDAFELLGLDKGASEAEINSAYRKLSLKYHPDKNKADEAVEMFRNLGEAKESALRSASKSDKEGARENAFEGDGIRMRR